MAITPFQRTVCRLLAETRIASGESYVAGGIALTELLATSRRSRDIDLFHDTEAALDASWQAGRRWHAMLTTAHEVIDTLPAAEVGRCVLTDAGALCRSDPAVLAGMLAGGTIRFHAGCIRGAMPHVRAGS